MKQQRVAWIGTSAGVGIGIVGAITGIVLSFVVKAAQSPLKPETGRVVAWEGRRSIKISATQFSGHFPETREMLEARSTSQTGDEEPRAMQRRTSRLFPAMTTAAILFAVLMPYILSYGPACDAFVAGELDPHLFAVTYYPITWTCKRSEWAAYVMGSYRLMWDRREWPTGPTDTPPPPGPRRLTPRWRW